MNKKQFANFHATLKTSFQAVKDDISKLKRRDNSLREDIEEIKKLLPTTLNRDEFFEYVRKMDDQMSKAIDLDTLTKTQDKLSQDIHTSNSELNADLKELRTVHEKQHKDVMAKIEDIKSEMRKTEDLKREVREVRGFKKQVQDLEKTFAKKKLVDECFEEQDEIYDLIEELETRIIKKKDIEAYQKLVDDKLRKFRDQMNDSELVAEKLNKKLGDISDSERELRKLSDTLEKVSSRVDKIDKAEEIRNLNTKFKEQNKIMQTFEKKLNELVDVTNAERESAIARLAETPLYTKEELEEPKVEKIKKPEVRVPEPVIFRAKKEAIAKETPKIEEPEEGEERRGFFGRIVDWFFEEVPEEEELEEEKKAEPKKEAKTEVKKEVKAEKKPKKEEKKEPKEKEKKEEKKEEEPEEERRGFFGRIVDWFLEEEPEEEELEEEKK